MNIGSMINSRRTALGLTLDDIGKAVGVSKSTVKKWEDGFIENMRRDKIAKLAQVLQISPVSLIVGELIFINEDQYNFYLTDHEKTVIRAYRSHPSAQIHVDKLLDVEPEPEEQKKRA